MGVLLWIFTLENTLRSHDRPYGRLNYEGEGMSERIGNIALIYGEKPQQCDLCGKIDELRPYGKNGEKICYDCGIKDKDTTERMMGIKLFGDNP